MEMGLDNQTAKFTICNQPGKLARMVAPTKHSTSKYRGVSWFVAYKKWRVSTYINGANKLFLGHFTDEMTAAKTDDKAALEHFGELARPNFPYG